VDSLRTGRQALSAASRIISVGGNPHEEWISTNVKFWEGLDGHVGLGAWGATRQGEVKYDTAAPVRIVRELCFCFFLSFFLFFVQTPQGALALRLALLEYVDTSSHSPDTDSRLAEPRKAVVAIDSSTVLA